MDKFIIRVMKKTGHFLTLMFLGITTGLFLMAKRNSGEGVVFSWLFISQLCSLLGTTLLAISFVLSTRWRFVEDWFGGMDKVYKDHHLFGGIAFVLVLHHPLFLILNVLPDINFSWKYLWLSNLLPYNWGILSLYSMMLVLILTLLINLPYSLWKRTHEFMGVALLFACLHIITITSDVSRFQPLRWWIVSLLLLAAYSAVYRRFLYGIFAPKFHYLVQKVQQIGDVFAIDMIPVDKKIEFNSGQFVFARFDNMGSEAHPFSIASGSGEEVLRIVVKILGDYSWKLGSLKKGSQAILWGPYGRFGEGAANDKDLIWIAGGIGITPFLSLLMDEVKSPKDRKIDLFYCVGTEEEAVFDEEITLLSAKDPRIIYHKYPSNVCGHLNVNKLVELCGSLENKKIMLCGPVSMMNSLAEQLKISGIKNKNIIFEDFDLK